ncbi:MAG: AI-2E family transporter [Oleiphilaceae bacterium]|nr:AI-2E family transporter [Oleiphilaceae bacterium]
MLKVVKGWFDRYFSDEEAVVLFLLLVGGLTVIVVWGDILAPVIASAILAFVLQGMVAYMVDKGLSQRLAVYFAFVFFVGLVLAFFFALLPLVWTQLSSLVTDIPRIFANLEQHLVSLQQQYPGIITIEDMENLYQQASAEVAGFLQWLVSHSLESLPLLVTFLIYLIVVPILVFFFLKDRAQIFSAIGQVLPANRRLMTTVWLEMNEQFANYVRGKVVEIMIVGGTTYMAFIFFDLNYGALLALLVGLSVVIPYIGAVVVTIPVTMIALFQYGLQEEFYWVMLAYLVIQMLDGNVLVPLLFSEVVNLHPIIIIVSVLFFGGIWGIWGVFFAIPLATLLKAVFNAWPRGLAAPSVDA